MLANVSALVLKKNVEWDLALCILLCSVKVLAPWPAKQHRWSSFLVQHTLWFLLPQLHNILFVVSYSAGHHEEHTMKNDNTFYVATVSHSPTFWANHRSHDATLIEHDKSHQNRQQENSGIGSDTAYYCAIQLEKKKNITIETVVPLLTCLCHQMSK